MTPEVNTKQLHMLDTYGSIFATIFIDSVLHQQFFEIIAIFNREVILELIDTLAEMYTTGLIDRYLAEIGTHVLCLSYEKCAGDIVCIFMYCI